MAAGVNPVDTYIRSGAFTRLPELPYVPGYDGAGVVEQLGEGVQQFKVFFIPYRVISWIVTPNSTLFQSWATGCSCPGTRAAPTPSSALLIRPAASGCPPSSPMNKALPWACPTSPPSAPSSKSDWFISLQFTFPDFQNETEKTMEAHGFKVGFNFSFYLLFYEFIILVFFLKILICVKPF